jgi:hypothetical protein
MTSLHRLPRPGAWPLVIALVSLWLLAACSGDDNGGPTQPAQPQTVSGQVTKGPVAGASVAVHAVAASGAPGAVIGGPWTTDTQGAWSGEIPGGSSGPLLVVATGGSYVDEASSATVMLGDGQLQGYVTGAASQVTPYTHMLVRAAQERIASRGESPAVAWAVVNARFQAAFGFDPSLTAPALSGSTAARTYLALLGGICGLLADHPALDDLAGADPFDLVLAFAADLADGLLDGLDAAGEAIVVAIGSESVAWPALDPAGIGPLVDAVNAWAAATEGLGDIELGAIDLDFSDPPAGSGSGALIFSGPGAAPLPQTTFTPTVFTANEVALAWAIASAEFSAQVGVTYAPGNPSAASIVMVSVATSGNSFGWQASIFGTQDPGVPGVAIDGQTVTFTNVILPPFPGTASPLTVNGQLGP